MDQAATLRNITDDYGFHASPAGRTPTKVISFTSGKGGVGKTNTVVNLAVALARMGKKVLLLDADLGLGNLDVLLGLAPRYNIGHLLRGEKTIEEVIVRGPAGIMILPASSGVAELTSLDAQERLALSSHLESLDLDLDVMFIDTGAGISSNVLFFNMAAQEIVVVATPEPTSITDAYALMKVMLSKHGERRFRLLVNSVKNRREARDVYSKLSLAAERFLGVSVDMLGYVLHDENLPKAVVRQMAVSELYPSSRASVCYGEVAHEIDSLPTRAGIKGGMQFFWRQFLTREF